MQCQERKIPAKNLIIIKYGEIVISLLLSKNIAVELFDYSVLSMFIVLPGDKKRRDVVQCIVHVPKYDFYIIASQKGIICQWSSKVQYLSPSKFLQL